MLRPGDLLLVAVQPILCSLSQRHGAFLLSVNGQCCKMLARHRQNGTVKTNTSVERHQFTSTLEPVPRRYGHHFLYSIMSGSWWRILPHTGFRGFHGISACAKFTSLVLLSAFPSGCRSSELLRPHLDAFKPLDLSSLRKSLGGELMRSKVPVGGTYDVGESPNLRMNPCP